MAPQARFTLQAVFRLIAEGKYWFSAKPRSSYAVVRAFASSGNPKSLQEAEKFILQALPSLTEAHFCESVIQWGDPKCVADVYGLIHDGRPWYVKFRVEDGELEEISFHPPERELKTVGGLIIPKEVTKEVGVL